MKAAHCKNENNGKACLVNITQSDRINKVCGKLQDVPALPEVQAIKLASGRKARFSSSTEDDLLIVENPDGFVELSVQFTADGPVLNFQTAKLNLKTRGDLSVDCREFKVNASENIQLVSEGDMVQNIRGDLQSTALGKSLHEAHTVEIRSTLGNVNLKANDDVRLDGERVKLNC